MVWFPEQTDFRISGLRISIVDGKLQVPPVEASTRTDVWHHWLHTGIEHLAYARGFAESALKARHSDDDEAAGEAVASECRASMVSAASAAFAVDGLHAAIKERIQIPPNFSAAWKQNRTARPKQVLEVLKIGCEVADREAKLDHAIQTIFKFRDWSAHPPAEFRETVFRDDLRVGVPWQYVAFSASNASQLVTAALDVATLCVWRPKLTWANLVVWAENKRGLVDQLRVSAGLAPHDPGNTD